MMKAKIIPAVCSGENPSFEGFVEMRPPFVEERWEYLEAASLLQDGEQMNSENLSQMDQIGMARKLVKSVIPHLGKHVLSVDLKHKESGSEIKSYDELRADPDAMPILIELASLLLRGFKPSKN